MICVSLLVKWDVSIVGAFLCKLCRSGIRWQEVLIYDGGECVDIVNGYSIIFEVY